MKYILAAAVLLSAAPVWAQQPQADVPDQAVAAQFQALVTQLSNASEAVQKLIESRKKLKDELEAMKSLKGLKVPDVEQPKVPEAPK